MSLHKNRCGYQNNMSEDVVDDDSAVLAVDGGVRKRSSSWMTLQIVFAVAIPPCLLLCFLYLGVPSKLQTTSPTAFQEGSDVGIVLGRPCDTPFGSVIGVADGVAAYSNCNSDYTSNLSTYINVTLHGANGTTVTAYDVYTGMPWQCVEYARRYWALTEPHATFGSVNGAADIWTELTRGNHIVHSPNNSDSSSGSIAEGGPAFTLLKYQNNNASSPPQQGDLIIYPVQPNGFPFGHVAAVLYSSLNASMLVRRSDDVNATAQDVSFVIHVGEQNWDSYNWAHAAEGYSRAIRGTLHQLTGKVSLWDPEGKIAGWVRRQPRA